MPSQLTEIPAQIHTIKAIEIKLENNPKKVIPNINPINICKNLLE